VSWLRAGQPENGVSTPGRGERFFFFCDASASTLTTAWPLIEWVLGAVFSGRTAAGT
jgi:hypothetical protein